MISLRKRWFLRWFLDFYCDFWRFHAFHPDFCWISGLEWFFPIKNTIKSILTVSLYWHFTIRASAKVHQLHRPHPLKVRAVTLSIKSGWIKGCVYIMLWISGRILWFLCWFLVIFFVNFDWFLGKVYEISFVSDPWGCKAIRWAVLPIWGTNDAECLYIQARLYFLQWYPCSMA